MDKVTIWDPNFFVMGKVFLQWNFLAILPCLLGVKGSKHYEWSHLFCGVFLIFWGVATLAIALLNKSLMADLFSNHSLSESARTDGEIVWGVIQISMPALAFSFGTRFVGNWLSAERPS